jgi:hypothetical protein
MELIFRGFAEILLIVILDQIQPIIIFIIAINIQLQHDLVGKPVI